MSNQSAHQQPGDSPADRPEVVRIEPRSTIWFDRYDRAGFYVLLIAFPLFAALGLLVAPLADLGSDAPMVAAETGQIEFPDAIVDRLSNVDYDEVSATIYLDQPTTGDRLIGLALPVVTTAMLGFGSALLFRITRAVQRGYAFEHSNVVRLRWLGFLIMFAGLVYSLGPPLTAAWLLPSEIDEFATTLSFAPMFTGLFAGMAVAMLSQAFSVGTDLTDEVSEAI